MQQEEVPTASTSGRPAFSFVRSFTGHQKAIAAVKFSPGEGGLLATASADGLAKLWSLDGGQEAMILQGHKQGLSDVSWHPSGRYLATTSDDHTLKMWDVGTGKCLRTMAGHTNFVFCCSFSPNGNMLVSGSFDETLRYWDVRSGTCLREVPAHSDPVTAVDFNHDGTLLVSSSLDGLCRLWDTQTGHCLKTLFDKDSPPVSFVRFTPNGSHILSSSLDGRLRLWDFEKGRAVKSYTGHENKKYCVFSTFCSSSGGGYPHPIMRKRGRSASGTPLFASGAVGKTEGDLEYQQGTGTGAKEEETGAVPGGSEQREGGGLGQQGSSGQVRREGRKPPPAPWIVSGSEDGRLYVYGLNSQKVLQVVGGGDGEGSSAHRDAVLCVDMHPQQPLLASSGHSKDGCVKLWSHTGDTEQ